MIYIGLLFFFVIWFGYVFVCKCWLVCYEDMEIVLWIECNVVCEVIEKVDIGYLVYVVCLVNLMLGV